jgi:hypothetical protein
MTVSAPKGAAGNMSEGVHRSPSAPAPSSVSVSGAADLLRPGEGLCASFHVALDTMDARRLRADPSLVSIPGLLLLDTGDYEPVLALVPLDHFWRMQGMDILAHTRAANRERRARPRQLPMSGSVWLVEATLDAPFRHAPGGGTDAAGSRPRAGKARPLPPCLRVGKVHALDRVTIERAGPRHIESIDVREMLPRFTERT